MGINKEEYIQEIATQLNINEDEVRSLVRTCLNTAKENLPQEQVRDWKQKLPSDWASLPQ